MSRLLLLALLCAGPALAARTAAPRTAESLWADSTAVVHARVVSAESRRVRHEIRTTYTLDPVRTLSGTAPERLVIELPGGRIGDALVEATGVPVWAVGDEVVVFLDGERPTSLDGLLTVEDDVVADPQHRPASAMPTTLSALSTSLGKTRIDAPR